MKTLLLIVAIGLLLAVTFLGGYYLRDNGSQPEQSSVRISKRAPVTATPTVAPAASTPVPEMSSGVNAFNAGNPALGTEPPLATNYPPLLPVSPGQKERILMLDMANLVRLLGDKVDEDPLTGVIRATGNWTAEHTDGTLMKGSSAEEAFVYDPQTNEVTVVPPQPPASATPTEPPQAPDPPDAPEPALPGLR